MDSDFGRKLGDLIEAALGMIEGVIWIIIVASGFLLSRRKQKRPSPKPMPASRDAWSGGYRERAPIDPGNQPGFGSTFSVPDSDRSSSDDPLSYRERVPIDPGTQPGFGSTFSAPRPDRSESDDPLSFGSLFDQPDEQRTGRPPERTKWGFDETEWGSSFGPKKTSEPKITRN